MPASPAAIAPSPCQKPTPGVGLPPQVSISPSYRRRRTPCPGTDVVGDDLKYRLGVVVQVTHDRGIHLIGDLQCRKRLLERLKVRLAPRTGNPASRARLAICLQVSTLQSRRRSGLRAYRSRHRGAQLRQMRGKIGLERLVVVRTAVGAADAVDVDAQPRHAQRAQYRQRQRDDFGISICACGAKDLFTPNWWCSRNRPPAGARSETPGS